MAQQRNIKKVVLAYSGGLDTSVILKWLQVNYGCEVITMTADVGQEDDLNGVDEKSPQDRRDQGLYRRPARRVRQGLHLPHAPLRRSV